MKQYLPTSNFCWRHIPLTLSQIMSWSETSSTGYMVECDLVIPHSLHHLFNDMPPCPEPLNITADMASPATKLAREHSSAKAPSQSTKLAPNLFNKSKYKVHIAALKYYLSLGVRLTRVHRTLQFTQSPWLSPYIEFNTRKRQEATSDFERSYYKLFNNSFFGKTMEVSIKIISL